MTKGALVIMINVYVHSVSRQLLDGVNHHTNFYALRHILYFLYLPLHKVMEDTRNIVCDWIWENRP